MSAHRRGDTRKGTSNLVRTSLRHRDQRRDAEDDDKSAIDQSLDDWADDMEGDTIWED